jgi:hypothetical protein
MKPIAVLLVAAGMLAGAAIWMFPSPGHAAGQDAQVFVTTIPSGYRDWRLVSVAREEGELDVSAPFWATTRRSRPIAKESFPSQKARSSLASPGATTRRRKTTRPLVVPSPSWPDTQKTEFSSWSRTRRNTRRPAAGGTLTSTTASLPKRPCSQPAFPATRPSRTATTSLLVTRLDLNHSGGLIRKPKLLS